MKWKIWKISRDEIYRSPNKERRFDDARRASDDRCIKIENYDRERDEKDYYREERGEYSRYTFVQRDYRTTISDDNEYKYNGLHRDYLAIMKISTKGLMANNTVS